MLEKRSSHPLSQSASIIEVHIYGGLTHTNHIGGIDVATRAVDKVDVQLIRTEANLYRHGLIAIYGNGLL